ncbi:signal peptide protein [Rhodopirellula sp. SWK7]|nr:signal peptide protein [Rhodopirellula sp. SWK7]
MLLSNVAGWMHVGCCDAESGNSGANHASVTAQASCCSHCHCHAGHQSSGSAADDSSNPDQESTPHDSESCHVCQNLFASRHAVLTSSATVVWEPLAIDWLRPELCEVSIEPVFLSGLSIRGPPNV